MSWREENTSGFLRKHAVVVHWILKWILQLRLEMSFGAVSHYLACFMCILVATHLPCMAELTDFLALDGCLGGMQLGDFYNMQGSGH